MTCLALIKNAVAARHIAAKLAIVTAPAILKLRTRSVLVMMLARMNDTSATGLGCGSASSISSGPESSAHQIGAATAGALPKSRPVSLGDGFSPHDSHVIQSTTAVSATRPMTV